MNYSAVFDNLKPKKRYLDHYTKEYWFAPQDVLLRSVEANIISSIKFKHPILDIGIGDGGISRFLFANKLKIDVGIDLESGGLGKARETGVYKKIMQANAENMPFEDASFNTVVSNSTFEHITNDLKAVKEVGRVLKENGLFFITVPSEFLPPRILELEKNKGEQKAKGELKKFNDRVNHFHYRPLGDWEKEMKKSGMKIIYHKYYYPEETTIVWYRLMKFSIRKIRNRETWSYLADSPIRKLIPEATVIKLLKSRILKEAYKKGLSATDKGSMIFIIAQKEK